MQPTHSTVDPTEPIVSRVLREAARYLTRHGWVRGSYYDQAATVFTPPACLVGAIGIVCYGGPVDAPAQHFEAPEWEAFEAAVAFLDRYLHRHRFADTAYDFNDAPGRKVEEVVGALAIAADAWDARNLRCPECGDAAYTRPPTDWHMPAWYPVPRFSHWDGTALCPVYGPEGIVPAEPVLTDDGAS
jgi:hypothetical protein